MTPAELRQHAAFSAMLWASSYPGRPQRLPATGLEAFVSVAEALVDLETSFFTPDAALAAALLRTGGRARDAASAAYQFFPRLAAAELPLLGQAPVGTYADPDQGATLVLGCTLGTGQTLALRGPGVQGRFELRVGGLPEQLWRMRVAAGPFPLGWDLLLIDGDQLVGLPRSVAVEVR
jgi:alpha-D-ribose 1-methylphosphonate 5-triphosphate synthase subunit PhnH